jgi:hypothetical protein
MDKSQLHGSGSDVWLTLLRQAIFTKCHFGSVPSLLSRHGCRLAQVKGTGRITAGRRNKIYSTQSLPSSAPGLVDSGSITTTSHDWLARYYNFMLVLIADKTNQLLDNKSDTK